MVPKPKNNLPWVILKALFFQLPEPSLSAFFAAILPLLGECLIARNSSSDCLDETAEVHQVSAFLFALKFMALHCDGEVALQMVSGFADDGSNLAIIREDYIQPILKVWNDTLRINVDSFQYNKNGEKQCKRWP